MGSQSDTHPEEIKVKAEESSSSFTLPKIDLDAPSTSASTSILPVSLSTDTNASTTNPTEAVNMDTSSSDPNSSVEPPPAQPPTEPVPVPEADPAPVPVPVEPPLPSLMDGDFQFGAYMASLGPRLKTLLNNIKADADPTVRLMALQDLSEILSMSTEDNLNGYFSQDSFVKELVRIMGGKSTDNEGEADDADSDEGEGGENPPVEGNEGNADAAPPATEANPENPTAEGSAPPPPPPAAAPEGNAPEAIIIDPMGMGIDPDDEDAALAAALAMSAGDAGVDLSAFGGGMGAPDENLEEQLLACRCLANLMEAMPGSAHTLVYHGAVPVLCSKLMQITFIDLAEQTISVCDFSLWNLVTEMAPFRLLRNFQKNILPPSSARMDCPRYSTTSTSSPHTYNVPPFRLPPIAAGICHRIAIR